VTSEVYNQSKVKMWRRCQKQYAFRYDTEPGKELVPKVKKRGLTLGGWLHQLVEAHNREWAVQDGFDPEDVYGEREEETWVDVHNRNVLAYAQLFDEEKEDLGDIPGDAERIFKAYLRFWKRERDRYRVAALHDGTPGIEFIIEVPLPTLGAGVSFKGRLDILLDDLELGGTWVRDYKWVKTIPTEEERMASPQDKLYVWGMKRLGYDLRGFVYDYGRTKAPAVPRVLQRGRGISKRKNMDTTLEVYVAALKEYYGSDWKIMAKTEYREVIKRLKGRDVLWFRREPMPVDKPARVQAMREFLGSAKQIKRRYPAANAPRSYFYSCKFNCEYHSPCVAEFQGLNIEPLLKKNYQLVSERYTEMEDLLAGG